MEASRPVADVSKGDTATTTDVPGVNVAYVSSVTEGVSSVQSSKAETVNVATDLPSTEDSQPVVSSSNSIEGPDGTEHHQSTRNFGNEEEDSDSTSEMSDFSDFSQESWHPVQGPIAWVQEQMRKGQDARAILEDLVPPGTLIPADIDPVMLWRLIINIVSEPPKRKKLESINTLEDVLHLLQRCKKIIVLTGAGVSVSCGIPDFRSRDGVYARLAVDFPNLPDPQAMFDIHFFRNDPRPFFKFAKEIYPGQFKPSLCHHFIRLIESQGKLLRNYTQNIDTLEQEAGIERVIQCHGSFATASCTNCKLKVKSDMIKEDIFKQVIPKCPRCPPDTENAVMKPDIVFFGESLPEDFHKQMAADKDECDLLIVIGSSLKVRPVALIPNSVPADVPQILINRERLHYLNFDVELLGNCDDIVSELCRRMGSGWEDLTGAGPLLNQVALSSLPTPPISPHSAAKTSPHHVESDVVGGGDGAVPDSSRDDSNSESTAGVAKADKGASSCGGQAVVNLDPGEDRVEATASDCDARDDVVMESEALSRQPSSPASTVSASVQVMAASEDKDVNSQNDVTMEEVSTSTAVHNSPVPGHGDCKRARPSDDVSSTSTGHKHHTHHHHHSKNSQTHHHHHHDHNHHHRHDHDHHHHHHHHKHRHHHNHHNHHHQQHHSNQHSDKSSSEHKGEKASESEPAEKRLRLDSGVEEDNGNATAQSSSSSSSTAAARLEGKERDELEEMRKMWQGRTNRISLAQRLAEDQFLFMPPNRYVFKGAEVFSDDDEDDEDDDDDDDDDDEDDEEEEEEGGENQAVDENGNNSSNSGVDEPSDGVKQDGVEQDGAGEVASCPDKQAVPLPGNEATPCPDNEAISPDNGAISQKAASCPDNEAISQKAAPCPDNEVTPCSDNEAVPSVAAAVLTKGESSTNSTTVGGGAVATNDEDISSTND